jgi:hypothetical protein
MRDCALGTISREEPQAPDSSRLHRLLKKSGKQIPRGLKSARDEKIRDLDAGLKARSTRATPIHRVFPPSVQPPGTRRCRLEDRVPAGADARISSAEKRPVSPLPRLDLFPHLTQGLRPGLTAMPPLRGWLARDSIMLSHQKIAFEVATQSLRARSTLPVHPIEFFSSL